MDKVILDQQYLLELLREVMENGENSTFNTVQEIMDYLKQQLLVAEV